MLQNRSIPYTSSWLNTVLLSSILATVVVFILVFLKPLESESNTVPFQNLKLIGYGLCIIIPLLIIHALEEYWYKKNDEKWFLYYELIILTIGFFFIGIVSYFYNTYLVNDLSIDAGYILLWIKEFGAPFAPIFMPLWIYLRFRFSKVVITPIPIKKESVVSLHGNNQNEALQFFENDFIMARAQANYVDIYYLKDGQVEKEMIRHTISGVHKAISSAQQIHRSYLVNPMMITSIKGNTRKGSVFLKHTEDEIPVSPKHFLGVKKYLQTRP